MPTIILKAVYKERKERIQEEIKSIYYKHNGLLGHKTMRIFLLRKGIRLSKTTIHKYMNKELSLYVIIMIKSLTMYKGQRIKFSPIF